MYIYIDMYACTYVAEVEGDGREILTALGKHLANLPLQAQIMYTLNLQFDI